jgi:hypothetical protein
VKGFNASAALISLFLGFTVVTQAQAEDYYIYQTPKGELVLTNKQPTAREQNHKADQLP